MLAAADELVLTIQQALCAEYGVACIQDIPAGVLPKLAEEGERKQVLQFIVASCPLDGLDEDGRTGLMLASILGHIDIVNALILAGAAVDTQDEYGRTALILASGEGHIDIVNALILAGAALDIQDDHGDTALITVSTYKRHIDVVNALILAGAELDIEDESGCTALTHASGRGRTEIVNTLSAAGATW